MDGTGDQHVKWRKPGSEGQSSYVFPQMWKLDLKDKCIHEIYKWSYVYRHMYICAYICIYRERHIITVGLSEEGMRGKVNDREWITWKHITSVYEESIMKCTETCWIKGKG
jgi:hypothetical protein